MQCFVLGMLGPRALGARGGFDNVDSVNEAFRVGHELRFQSRNAVSS
jgi:hypothetical protein